MTSRKLSRAQAGQLGGFAAARALGDAGVYERGSKGGATTSERYGKEHYVRAAHLRWGRKGAAKKVEA